MAFIPGFLTGLAAWTLLEYVIHRWLGHLPKGRIFTSSEHLRHHADVLYFTPIPLKILGAIPVLATAFALASWLSGAMAGAGFTVAIACGWTLYEWLHESIHVRGPRNRYARWAARHHLSHHFGKARSNYGVTTPVWDWIFGSHAAIEQVRIPRKFQPGIPWLGTASASGQTEPEFRRDYELEP